MYKILSLMLFMLAFSKAEVQNVSPLVINSYNSSILHTDGYIILSRQQHQNVIQNYSNEIELLKQTYYAGLRAIEIQSDMLIQNLTQTNERLTLLEALGGFSKTCVNTYRKIIPTPTATKMLINSCINTAQNQISSILYSPLSTKLYLESYYTSTYEKSLNSCQNKFSTSNYYLNYTMCVVEANNAAQDYTISSQKLFDTQMDSSRCTADANIKKALDCNYSIQSRTISQITEANLSINNCLLGQGDCKQCSVGYWCPYVSYMDKTDVSTYSKTIANPFYGESKVNDCLMLKLY